MVKNKYKLLLLCCVSLLLLFSMQPARVQGATPSINSSSYTTAYQYGTSGSSVHVTFTATDPDVSYPYYVLYLDDMTFKSGNWYPGVETEISWTSVEIAVGIHSMNLTLYDGLGWIYWMDWTLEVEERQPIQSVSGYQELIFIPILIFSILGVIIGLKRKRK